MNGDECGCKNQFAIYFNRKNEKNKFNHPIIQNHVSHEKGKYTVETMISRKPESSFKWNLEDVDLLFEYLAKEIPKTYEVE